MKKFLYLALALVIFSCSDDDKKSKTKTELLTDGSSKSWKITAQTPEHSDPNCRPTAEHVKDNTWTFYANGDFTFDRGTITQTENCSDFSNIEGGWEFISNENRISLTTNPFPFAVLKLEESELILVDVNAVQTTYSPK